MKYTNNKIENNLNRHIDKYLNSFYNSSMFTNMNKPIPCIYPKCNNHIYIYGTVFPFFCSNHIKRNMKLIILVENIFLEKRNKYKRNRFYKIVDN
jgi:hypothetical protein